MAGNINLANKIKLLKNFVCCNVSFSRGFWSTLWAERVKSMPRHQKKAVLASSALKKRWANRENLFSTISTADTATQTERAEKNSHGTQTETESSVDIGTADEIVAFAADINQQLANLPVSIGMSDLDESMTGTDRQEVHTKQMQQILTRYSHDLRRATSHTMMVVDSELVVSDVDFLVAAFESQICEKCNVSGQLRMTTKTQVKPGIVELELTCLKCFEKSKHKSDCRTIESRFRPKAWLPNYLLLSFLLNGEYFKDYEHVLGTLGVGHLSKSQWIRVVKWVHPHVKDLAQWSCDEIKREIARRGDKKSLEIMYDGFYLTRGYHANNASGTIHDVKSGKIVAFAHRSKRGLGSNWVGTSGGAEGDIFEELLTGLKDGHFNVKECTIDHDATCANVLLEQFPEAEVIYCGNHTIKTFHSDLANIKKISCQVRLFFFLYSICFLATVP